MTSVLFECAGVVIHSENYVITTNNTCIMLTIRWNPSVGNPVPPYYSSLTCRDSMTTGLCYSTPGARDAHHLAQSEKSGLGVSGIFAPGTSLEGSPLDVLSPRRGAESKVKVHPVVSDAFAERSFLREEFLRLKTIEAGTYFADIQLFCNSFHLFLLIASKM
jgi:hypothetical protein